MTVMASTTLSGAVLLVIHHQGVLLRGPEAVGKSELALALLDRGHQLVADDRVKITRQHNQLIGQAVHTNITGFIETRELGILHVGSLFGSEAIAQTATLALIVELLPASHNRLNRLSGHFSTTTLLDVTVNQFSLSSTLHRRADLFVEIALRQCQLRQDGYDSSHHFCQQQQSMILANESLQHDCHQPLVNESK